MEKFQTTEHDRTTPRKAYREEPVGYNDSVLESLTSYDMTKGLVENFPFIIIKCKNGLPLFLPPLPQFK